MIQNLKPIAEFAKASPFTEHQVRWWIFNASSNGLDNQGAVVRVGRRVYLDVPAFERWIAAQQKPAQAAA